MPVCQRLQDRRLLQGNQQTDSCPLNEVETTFALTETLIELSASVPLTSPPVGFVLQVTERHIC